MNFSDTSSSLPLLQSLTLERKRLLEKFGSAVRHKLTLLVAPPGYGKTTLATQFAHLATLPVAWHSVEKWEYDVANLFEHCLTALSAIAPDILNIRPYPGATASELAVLVTDHLRKSLKSDIVYILDDVQFLIDSPTAEAWLNTLIASIPATCHLVLVGRALPTISLIEMITHREVLAIGPDDLSFTFQEVTELAEKAGFPLNASDAHKLNSRLGGWPAGMFLALQPLPAEVETLLFYGKAGPEGLFDALAEVMFHSQPSPLQEFLLCSSTLSRMNPNLCQAALHMSNSIECLTEALNRNLFISRVPGGLVYHALFRDYLQNQLKRDNPERFAQLHAGAGRWFESDNRLDEAFEHYVAAELWDEAIAIVERTAQPYFSQGKTETVLNWRREIGEMSIHAPRLLYTCSMIHRDRYEYDLARADLAEAEAGFRARNNETGLIESQLLAATIDNQRGQHQQAIDRAEPFLHLASLPSNLYGYALAILGIAHLYLGHGENAVKYLEEALPRWRVTGDKYALAQLLMNMQLAYFRLGRLDEAEGCLEEVLAIRRELGGTNGVGLALNNLGYHYQLRGEYEKAFRTFQEGLQVVSRVPDNRTESYLLWSMGDLHRDRGAFGEAFHFYQKALQRMGTGEPFLRSTVLANLSTLRRWEKNLDEASQFALDALKIAEHHHLALEALNARLAIGAIHIERGELEIAQGHLENLAVSPEVQQTPAQLLQTLGMCAQISLLRNDAVATDRYFKSAIESARHPANLQPLIAEIVHNPLLKTYILDRASRYEVLIEGISRLDDAQVESDHPKPLHKKLQEPTTYSLRIHAFSHEKIERDGKVVSPSTWQAASARELFFYLLFRGSATREQIGLDFWPDSSADQVRKKFHTTLRRARDAVGANVILFEDDRYFLNPQIDVWCDVYEFETVVQQARLTSPLIAHTEMQWHHAIALYRGEFLPAFDADWVVNYRESLGQMYLEALLALGNCVRRHGNLREAISILKQALEIDPYREDIHRALLTCYAALGERSSIVRQLDELKHILRHELGINPSVETLTLAQSLLQ